jgi:uncharacterized DUF497 family protein
MRIDAIDIEEHILDKIETKHAVTFEECEEVCRSPRPHIRRVRDRILQVFRRTDAGRYLIVLVAQRFAVCWVISARDMNASERRLYERQTGR